MILLANRWGPLYGFAEGASAFILEAPRPDMATG
jgi:hypothetical protein